MSSEWPFVEVEQACELIVDCVNKTAPIVPEKTPYRMIRTTNIRNGRVSLEGCRYVDESTFKKWTRRANLQFGDVVLTREAPIGEVGFVTEPKNLFLGQRLMQYRANPDFLVPRFLLYAFLSPSLQYQFGSHEGSGSVVSHICVGDCFKFKIPLPPLLVQTEIAETLGALDDRIALLRETNTTLEAIAQALFKSWFVDFDPVHAKQEGREPEGMDAVTTALFPDSFEESELGLIPTGWQTGTLANLATLNPESWTAKRHPATIAYIDLANAKDNEISAIIDYSFNEAPSRARRALRDGDTIVGTVRPGNRSFAFIHTFGTNLTASTGFAVLRPCKDIDTEFVYLAATQESNIEHLAHVADGGAYPAVRPEVVVATPCVLPIETIMKKFHEVTAPLLESITENQKRSKTLVNLRDTLLPRLISGQLRLPEAEALVEEAVA